jgi:cation diffusion facilitator CzcD-associated flavoprotein CzcO
MSDEASRRGGQDNEGERLARTELAGYADRILLWKDRYEPPPQERHPELANFPYLAYDFSFIEGEPGSAPWLSNIHCFNYGATLSLVKVSGDIPGVSEGAAWLARSIAASLYVEDVESHFQALLAYAKPKLEGDEWAASELPSTPFDESDPICALANGRN